MTERRYDIDWLRALTMGAVFFFHSARFFGGGTWHLNNTEQSMVAFIFMGFFDMWFMSFFFLLSGVGSWYGLSRKTGGQYVWERAKRLLIPLYTVGLLLLIPPQFYFELYSNAGYNGMLWEVFPGYFDRFFQFSVNHPRSFIPFPWSGHLWFLRYLFLISLLCLPLMLYLKSERGRAVIARLAAIFNRTGGIYLFAVILVINAVFFGYFLNENNSWFRFINYTLFFLMGFLLPADKRFTESIFRHRWFSLACGVVGFAAEGYMIIALNYNYPGAVPFSTEFIIFSVIMALGSWGWITFFLGTGSKHLNFNHKYLNYANEAVLPFYIFHQTIILLVGWYVINWDMAVLPKFIIISILSFAGIMVLYEGLVRRLSFLRFLFGMKNDKKY